MSQELMGTCGAAVGSREEPVAEFKDSAAGFFLPMEIIMKEIAVKSEGVLPK